MFSLLYKTSSDNKAFKHWKYTKSYYFYDSQILKFYNQKNSCHCVFLLFLFVSINMYKRKNHSGHLLSFVSSFMYNTEFATIANDG